jgi:hypothetical protein
MQKKLRYSFEFRSHLSPNIENTEVNATDSERTPSNLNIYIILITIEEVKGSRSHFKIFFLN